MVDKVVDTEPKQVLHTPKEPVLRHCKSECGLKHAGPWGKHCKLLAHNGGTICLISENVPDRANSSDEEIDTAGSDGRAPGEVNTTPRKEHGEIGIDEEASKTELDDMLHLIQAEKERNSALLRARKLKSLEYELTQLRLINKNIAGECGSETVWYTR